MKKKRRIGSLILIIILAVVAAACFIYWLNTFLEEKQGEDVYQEIAETYIMPDDTDAEDPGWPLQIDWDSLLSECPEVVGWLYLNEDCSYPIVQHSDNSYYLDHSPYLSYSINGAIFMNADNSSDFSDRNTVIYGHNMNNGSMFGSNKKYRDKSFVDEHPYFYIYTPNGNYTSYQIYSVAQVTDATRPYEIWMVTNSEFKDYIMDTINYRLFDMSVGINSGDSVVTLSTCAKHNTLYRLIIQGVKRDTKSAANNG